jgi:hypothetical protein
VQAGKNRLPKPVRSAQATEEKRAWAAAQEARRSGNGEAGGGGVTPLVGVPEGRGEVPWHEISDLRLTDSLVARVNCSNGDLMLAATDFDVAGVGRNLQPTRTHNSFTGAYGQVSDRWRNGYERLQQLGGPLRLHRCQGLLPHQQRRRLRHAGRLLAGSEEER